MSEPERVRFRGTDVTFRQYRHRSVYVRVGRQTTQDVLTVAVVSVLLQEGVLEEDVPPVAELMADKLVKLVSVGDAEAIKLARRLIAYYGEAKVLKVIEALR